MEVLQRTANRGSISTGFDIDNSLKLERANSEYLNRTPSSSGNQQIFTFSSWVKFSHINSGVSEWSTLFSAGDFAANSPSFRIGHHTNNALQVSFYTNSAYTGYYRTDALYRDTAAWYHFVCAVDTTQGTNTNRVKIYVNGVLAPTTSAVSHVAQNYNSGVNTEIAHRIGHGVNMQTYASEYVAETHFVDGQALAPTEFGEFDDDSGIWIPKAASPTYGTNGFYLDYADASDLGDDESGNGNDWTENNIAAADQATDTPTNNFCTLVGDQQFVPSKATTLVREGGTIMYGGQNSGAYSTMGVRSGKWYFESTLLHLGGVDGENHGFGVIAADRLYEMNIAGEDIGADVGGWACSGNANPRNNNAGASGGNHITAPGINVVLGCALDMDNGKIWWHNAGTWHSLNSTVGNPANGTSPAFSNLLTATDDFVLPAAGLYANGAGPERAMNFGGYALPAFTAVGTYSDANGYGSFAYAPPSGYYAICTKNLAEFG